MRTVESHLLEDKMDDAVTHYINSHHSNEPVHIDTNGIPMTVQDDGAGRVTIMHQQTYTTQMCRQVSVTEQVGDGPWGEELLEGPIAAIVAHLQNPRHHPPPHHKVTQVRGDVDTSVILDGSIRFNGQSLEQPAEPIVMQLPPMQTLPPLQDMKRCADTDWFTDKNKKDDAAMLQDSDSQVLELASSSPAQHKQSRKSLPHKKRISRKLRRNNGNSTPQQELVVINCSEGVSAPEQEQILPDNYVAVPHAAHIPHEVRPVLICQICGEYYGEEQLKFYHHLRQHYDHHTIIIENPVTDMTCDKMSNNCIVDNVATLPDSIVELSLENTVPKTLYQPIDKHILYAGDKSLNYNANKVPYGVGADKEGDKCSLYESLDKLELYSCGKCTKTFRKQRHCEAHVKEAHPVTTKCEDMGEFSEPEDLMAGIQVCVGAEYEAGAPPLPHLTVDNGHVHQEHAWYGRAPGAAPACGGYCGVCARDADAPYKLLKEEVLQRIFDSEVSDNANFGDNMITDHDVGDHDQDHDNDQHHGHNDHGQRQNDHGHVNDRHAHLQDDHQLHNDHLRHSDHSNSQQNEHEQEHNEHSQGHNEQSLGHEQSDHVEHNDNSHDQELNQDHREASQEQYGMVKHENGTKEKKFSCNKCDRVFSHRNSLLYHALSHSGKQHSCRECGKGFYTHTALKIHRRVHSNQRPYKCDVCDRDFRQWSDLRYHKISLHSDKKHFKCEYCGKEFARKYSLNLHVRIHTGEKNYKCHYCTKTFRCSSYRLTHMRTHTGDRPHQCEECEKSFSSAFDLRRHSLVHDKIRNRFDEHKPKQKDKKTKMTDTKEEKLEKIETIEVPIEIETPTETSPKKIKQIAVASTTRQAVLMKKQKPKKLPKKGAPNVTIQNREGPFKNDEYTHNNVQVYYDGRVEYTKLKSIYIQGEKNQFKDEANNQRDLAVLRPIGHKVDALEKQPYRAENTDGKIFTHVEKGKEYNGSIVANGQIGDVRHGETREIRGEAGEGIESAFLERLTAMYNIPAV